MKSIETMINQAIGGQADMIVYREPSEYQSNQLYDVWRNGRHLIAKEYLKPDELLAAPRREYGCMQYLTGLNIAPKPVFYAAKLGPLVIYEYMAGEVWPRKRPLPAMLKQLAETWTILHNLPTDDLWLARSSEQSTHAIEQQCDTVFQSYAEWTAVYFPPGQPAANMCLNLLPKLHTAVEKLSQLKPILCFCQSDTRFANILTRPDGRLALIDWEDGGLGDPALDLVNFLVAPNEEDLMGKAEWEELLRPYLTHRTKHDPTFQQRMQHYLTSITIFWIALFCKTGMQKCQTNTIHKWQIHHLPANYRLQRYLARAMGDTVVDFQLHLTNLTGLQFFPEKN